MKDWGVHPHDVVTIRIAPDDSGQVLVIGNSDTGMVVLLAVAINPTELHPEMIETEHK